jgi:hypothetical protein
MQLGQGGNSIASADFDGDGNLDLAVAGGHAVIVFPNNGDGTFAIQMTIPVGEGPSWIALGDLDGDGDNDLAVGSSSLGSISVWLNDGDATFTDQRSFGTATDPASIAIGDLDGDGDNDLAYGGIVSVLLNNGDGTFAALLSFDVGDGPFSVALGDLDGDGDNDLAVANVDIGRVPGLSVLLNNGDGTFAAQLTFGVGEGPESVAIGDLNGDGNNDLVVANHISDSVSVLLNKGDGTFATQVAFSVGDVPQSVAMGDFDHDGDNDLAVTKVAPQFVCKQAFGVTLFGHFYALAFSGATSPRRTFSFSRSAGLIRMLRQAGHSPTTFSASHPAALESQGLRRPRLRPIGGAGRRRRGFLCPGGKALVHFGEGGGYNGSFWWVRPLPLAGAERFARRVVGLVLRYVLKRRIGDARAKIDGAVGPDDRPATVGGVVAGIGERHGRRRRG